MRLSKFSKNGFGRAVVFALAGLAAASAQAGGEPEKIEFSEPNSPVIVSNLNRLGIGQASLKDRIQEDLFSPFKGMNNSFDPVVPNEFQPITPPPQQPALSKKQQEQIQEQVEWVFTGMTEQSSKDNLGELLGIKQYDADGTEKKTLTPVEKYYESLGKQQSLSPELLRESLGVGRNKDFSGTNSYSPLNFAFQGNQQDLEKMFVQPNAEAGSTSPDAENGNPNNPTPAEQKRALEHADFMRQLLGGSAISGPPGAGLFGGSAPGKNGDNKGASAAAGDFGAAPGASGSSSSDPLSDYFGSQSTPADSAAIVPAAEPHSTLNPFLGVGSAPNYQSSVQNDPTRTALGLPQTYQLPPPVAEPAKPPQNAQATFGFLPAYSLPKRPF